MSSRRPGADPRAFVLALVLSAPSTALAETFHYVDRQGHAHDVEVSTDSHSSAAPPPEDATDLGATPYLAYAMRPSAAYRIPLSLVLAVIKVESGFNPRAVSERGALGLMQLMPATAADLGVSAPFDPGQNIDGGVRYLRAMLDDFSGDLELALAAYHAGPARVRRAQGAPFEVTRRYVRDVLRAYEKYLYTASHQPSSSPRLSASGEEGGGAPGASGPGATGTRGGTSFGTGARAE